MKTLSGAYSDWGFLGWEGRLGRKRARSTIGLGERVGFAVGGCMWSGQGKARVKGGDWATVDLGRLGAR